VATTNFPQAIDEAFLSRTDLTVNTVLPDERVVALIVADTLRVLADHWPGIRPLAIDANLHKRAAATLLGCDGRRIRKAVYGALTRRIEVAEDPERVTENDILSSARSMSLR